MTAMPVPDIDGNVKKVYISDSPVLDDHVQYNYVNSDFEDDEPESPRKPVTDRRSTPGPALIPAPDDVDVAEAAGVMDDTLRTEGDLNDEDELAMEAEYQRQLQERLQNATLKDESESATPVLSDPHADPLVRQGKSPVSRNQTQTLGDSTEWSNPPPNPFPEPSPEPVRENTTADNEVPQPEEVTADPKRFEDMNLKNQDEKFVPENFSKPTQPVPQPRRRQLSESPSKPPESHPTVQPNPFMPQQNPTHFPAPQQHTTEYPQQMQGDYTYTQQKPHPSPSKHNNVYQYYNQPQPQQYTYNTHTQNPFHKNPNFMPEQFAPYQPQTREEPVAQGMMIGLQRNAPVMYLNTAPQNEYQVATPREIHHPYVPVQQVYPGVQPYRNEDEQSEVASESSLVDPPPTNRSNKVKLPPKPQKPQKNYLEKNKSRVKGQVSAKLGYSDRLVQRRIEQEQLKEWAPGMVLPRKKAASADDIIRAENGYTSPEDVWSKRSKELAIAKKSGGTRKSKKLPRYPSDSNLVNKTTPKIPPINPKGGYVSQFQQQQTYYNQTQPQTQPPEQPGFRQLPEHPGYRQEQPHPGYRQAEPQIQSYANNFQQQQKQAFQQPQPQPQAYSPPLEQYSQPVPQAYYQQQPHSYQTSPTQPLPGGYSQAPPRQPEKPNYNQPPQGYQPEYPNYDYSGYEDQHTEKSAAVNGMYSSPSVDSYFQPYNPSKPAPLNPYTAVPPIKQESNQTQGAGGSYIQAYQEQKEKAERAKNPPQYKVYTMKDYKKLKLEYKLGGLGPSQDPIEVREKNENRMKQLQYAKEAMDNEKKKPQVVVSPRKEKSPPVQQISSRQLMVEYARNNIPKPSQPQPKPTNSVAAQKPTSNNPATIPALNPLSSSPSKQSPQPALTRVNDTSELDEMTRRHEEESRIMNDIQYQLEQTV